MEFRRVIRQTAAREHIGYPLDQAAGPLIRPAAAGGDIVLRQAETERQNIVHLQIGLDLRYSHVNDFFDVAERHGLDFLENQRNDRTHSFRTFDIIAGTLTDTTVGNRLHAFQRLYARRFDKIVIFFADIFCRLSGIFVQLIDLVLLHIDGNAADRVNHIRHRLEVYDDILAEVNIQRLIQ